MNGDSPASPATSMRQLRGRASTPGYQHYKEEGGYEGIPKGMHTNPISKNLQGGQASVQFLSSQQNEQSVKGLGRWNRQSTIDFGDGDQSTPMPKSVGA